MLIFIFIQVLLCQGDVWKYKHLEKDLKIAFDELFVVREGCTFAKVSDNGEYQSFTLAVCCYFIVRDLFPDLLEEHISFALKVLRKFELI